MAFGGLGNNEENLAELIQILSSGFYIRSCYHFKISQIHLNSNEKVKCARFIGKMCFNRKSRPPRIVLSHDDYLRVCLLPLRPCNSGRLPALWRGPPPPPPHRIPSYLLLPLSLSLPGGAAPPTTHTKLKLLARSSHSSDSDPALRSLPLLLPLFIQFSLLVCRGEGKPTCAKFV